MIQRIGGAFPLNDPVTRAGSILEFVRALAAQPAILRPSSMPSDGSTLIINGQALGGFDYCVKEGNQTISSFSAADWFTSTPDCNSAICVVKGNLTINGGQVFTPAVRKLFTVLYVTGDLVLNGEISMSQRGAAHDGVLTGMAVTATAIRIATGLYSSVTNPQVPAAGANGGTAVSRNNNNGIAGNNGSTGTNGACGGGGSGGAYSGQAYSATSGAGAAGTSFSGGPGGGGAQCNGGNITAGSGAANGGAGGNASTAASCDPSGGAGNQGGAKGTRNGEAGDNGTGGVLIIIVEGQLSGSGAITAAGADGGGSNSWASSGGGSGGGSATVLYGTDTSSITPTAVGGAGPVGSNSTKGGNGGDGTARKLALMTDANTMWLNDSATSTSGTIDVPDSVQAGDWLVLLDHPIQSSGAPTKVIPDGFTEITSCGFAGSGPAVISHKLAVGDEAGSTLTGSLGNSNNRKILAVFRKSQSITGVTVAGAQAEATAGDPTPQTIASHLATAPAMALGAYAVGSTGNCSTRSLSSEDGDVYLLNTVGCAIKFKFFLTNPADVTADLGDEGSYNNLMSAYASFT